MGDRQGARSRRHRIQKLSARLRTASLLFLKLERTTAYERAYVSAQDLAFKSALIEKLAYGKIRQIQSYYLRGDRK